MSRGQKWGTYESTDRRTAIGHMDTPKLDAVKDLAEQKELTVSALINKLLSIELAKAGINDPSASYEL